nr:immunoglobulin light chain junction region [Macaca mulatta]MOX69555.1 immunoglobulin light chain junction region [Macaca mulatta]MOX69835.1 immunoglobulin light chain junction region [Macaca mulatta]MOX69987.1 immunoglobulin light chain junction region [Macaca mulatta]MOX70669.1 immunoglobulin light chain junction region [Macaca mulatta]
DYYCQVWDSSDDHSDHYIF